MPPVAGNGVDSAATDSTGSKNQRGGKNIRSTALKQGVTAVKSNNPTATVIHESNNDVEENASGQKQNGNRTADSEGDHEDGSSSSATAEIEKRMHRLWNVHDIRKFSADYEDEEKQIESFWDSTFRRSSTRSQKRPANSPEFIERPAPYKKTKTARSEFLEMTPVNDFLVQLHDPEFLSRDELYAVTSNVANALKAWQDEYLAIDRLIRRSTRNSSKHIPDPRKPELPEVYEDKKEAALYGYRYEAKADKINNQDPFVQGGFRPNPAQLRRMKAKVDPSDPNPDGWPSISRFSVPHIPKFRDPPPEDFVGKQTRKRKAAEAAEASGVATRATTAQNTPETQAPAEKEMEKEKREKQKKEKFEEKETRKRTTPAVKAAHPKPSSPHKTRRSLRTRQGRATATPEEPPAETPPETPASTPGASESVARVSGSGRGRGPGRPRGSRRRRGGRLGRVARRVAVSPSLSVEAETSRPTSPGLHESFAAKPTSSPTTPASIQDRPEREDRPESVSSDVSKPKPGKAAAASKLKPASRPKTGKAAAAAAAVAAAAQSQEENIDPVEAMRRQKIMASKNPRRTEAMLNHWERFNAEGRVRNPKRSREEIEVARADAATKKKPEAPKMGGRRRKLDTTGLINGPINIMPDLLLPPIQAAEPPPIQPLLPPPPQPAYSMQPPNLGFGRGGYHEYAGPDQHSLIDHTKAHTKAQPVHPSLERAPPPALTSPQSALPPPPTLPPPSTFPPGHVPPPSAIRRASVYPPPLQPALPRPVHPAQIQHPYPQYSPTSLPPLSSPSVYHRYESPYGSALYESPYEPVPLGAHVQHAPMQIRHYQPHPYPPYHQPQPVYVPYATDYYRPPYPSVPPPPPSYQLPPPGPYGHPHPGV